MAKKLIVISLAVFYASFNVGVIINYHFCGSEFHHLTLLIQPDNCCGSDCSCCHNSSYELNVKDKYDSQSTIFLVTLQTTLALSPNPDLYISDTFGIEHEIDSVERGPLIQNDKYPVYLRNRVILI